MQQDQVQVQKENSPNYKKTYLNIKRLSNQNELYFLQSSVSKQNQNQQDHIKQYQSENNHESITKSNHKSAYSSARVKDEPSVLFKSSYKQNENQQNYMALDKQYMNFPLLETKKKSLQILQQQLFGKKGDAHLNISQSLPKLKLLQDYEFQNSQIGIQNHKIQKKKVSSTDWSINQQNQYQSQGNQQKNLNMPKNLKPLEYRPKMKLMEYMSTEPKESNDKQPNKMSDKFKSLLQLRQSIHYTSQQSLNQSQGLSPLLRVTKEQESIPYLSSKIEKQQKEQQLQQQLTMKKFNESFDRRFKFSCKTKAGCTYDKTPKINQDSPIIYPKQLGELGISLFAVCDGHGTNGHFVSGMIRKSLPKYIQKYVKELKKKTEIKQSYENDNNKSREEINKGVIEENQIQVSDLKNSIQQGFQSVNQEILKGEHDSNLSGSTLVSVFIIGNNLICSNVGDSRAVLAKSKFGSDFKAFPLSIDHKPSLEREKQRILASGGRVSSQKGNPIGPLRVWMNTIDIPGLAMTRSFGDKVGMQAGVNCEPEIIETELTEEDKFIIVASDGVWEHISSQDAVRIVEPYYEKGYIEQAAERLVIEASNAWKKNSQIRKEDKQVKE